MRLLISTALACLVSMSAFGQAAQGDNPIIDFGHIQLFEVDTSNKIIATLNVSNTIGLKLNDKEIYNILTLRKDSLLLSIPFFGCNLILNLEKYQPYSDNVQTRLKTRDGDKDIMITPQLLSYKLIYDENSIGILNFVNNQIKATFVINKKQYEISKYKNKYVIFDVNNSINQSGFSCVANPPIDYITNSLEDIGINMSVGTAVCIETAIEIDHYTRNTFSTDQETLDWALANISGVSQLYQAQTNAKIQVVHVTIWDVIDPYDTCSTTGSVLTQIRDNWMSNNAAINRDHVHFLSRRGLSGGVTYGGGLCDINWHYAVSAALGTDTSFTFPNPTYSWNLNLIAHELGHNIGSAHTNWCGWVADTTDGFVGGGIDDCAVSAGYANACSPPAPSPDSEGTIMSYCHLSGQGIILEFHDVVVSQALIPGLANASCVTTCNSDGCTDYAAFNYNPSALTDDGSCIYLMFGCTDSIACNYNLEATDSDNSCVYIGDSCDDEDPNTDDDEIQEDCECVGIPQTIVNELEALSVLIYPNPTSNNLTVDLGDLNGVNTTIKLYDSSSKLVFEKQSTSTLIIDVSVYAKGLYNLEISTSDKVLRSQVVIE